MLACACGGQCIRFGGIDTDGIVKAGQFKNVPVVLAQSIGEQALFLAISSELAV